MVVNMLRPHLMQRAQMYNFFILGKFNDAMEEENKQTKLKIETSTMVVHMLRPHLMPWATRQVAIFPHLSLTICTDLQIVIFKT